jgi:heme-degrading monooxygenase HmoA
MYGSISRWRAKAGKEKELEELADELMRTRASGSRAVYVYRSDATPGEYWVAGIFESREAYTSNSAAPEQDARFRRLRELMESDPEWHDGEIVVSYS